MRKIITASCLFCVIGFPVGFIFMQNPISKFDCNKTLPKKDVLFLHGGILDKYDNGRVFVSIQRVNNPKDWNANEYFTGKGFSKDEKKLLKVLEKDSCELKQKYFKFIKSQ